MKTTALFYLLLCFCLANAQPPASFQSFGIGGGGALFSPSINPGDENELYIASDLSALFHSTDFGDHYSIVHFSEVTGGAFSKVCFTSDPLVRYTIKYDDAHFVSRPAKSADGGNSWTFMPGNPYSDEEFLFIYANFQNPAQVLITTYNELFVSQNGGASFSLKYSAADPGAGILLSGVFFDGPNIYCGTNDGVVISNNSGSSFSLSNFGGIPAAEAIMGFGAAKSGGTLRFFALTGDKNDVYATNMGFDYYGVARGVYRMDNLSGNWASSSAGIDFSSNFCTHLAMAENDINTCYLSGGNDLGEPIVLKTGNGGQQWNPVFLRNNNQNIQTGYCGYQGDLGWSWAGNTFGLAVAPTNASKVLFSDYGFVHKSFNGGQTWRQSYSQASDSHSANAPTPKKQYYRGIGMEQTTVWDIAWFDSLQMMGCFTDIRGVRSADGGDSWSFDYNGHDQNTMYRVVKHRTDPLWFAATSSVHDIYQTTYVTDQRLFPSYAAGRVLWSNDKGKSWQILRDFGKPVVWLATDPTHSDRLYASVLSPNPAQGGIWRCDGIGNPATATWTKLPSPPANHTRPFNIHVLNDGTLVTTWSARKSNSGSVFSDSSGVFISNTGGSSWLNRTHPEMKYWTKDLIVDPADPAQNTWYACVWSGWGGPANDLGGLFRTTDRGVSWTRLTGNQFLRVSSLTFDPLNAANAYLTTELEGLWYSDNMNTANPTFTRVESYPFAHPERVFFNPYKAQEVWVASFGYGMVKGQQGCAFEPVISGPPVSCSNTVATYSVPPIAGSTYVWTVTGGVIISGQGTAQITVQWDGSGVGNVAILQEY